MTARWVRFLAPAAIPAAIAAAAWAVHMLTGFAALPSLLVALLIAAVVHVAILGIGFAIAATHSAGEQASPSEWWRALLGEMTVSAWAFYWAMPFRAAFAAPAAQGTRLPVVLVHGYLCNRGVWHRLARRLHAIGHNVEAVNLKPVFGSIDGYARLVDQAVQRACARSGKAQVALIGHSMGGLAIRAYAREFGTARVAGIITLGTPHNGTTHAGLGLGANARQMRRNSRWLAALAASEPAELRQRMLCVYSRHDNLVAPFMSATLEGARTHEISGIGHLQLTVAPLVLRAVEDELQAIESR